jgi:hypothetical protein
VVEFSASRKVVEVWEKDLQQVARRLETAAAELRVPERPMDDPIVVEVSLDSLIDANRTLTRTIRAVLHVLYPPPGGLKEPAIGDLPLPGPHLGDKALSRALQYIRKHATTYEKLAQMTEAEVTATRQVGAKGLDRLRQLLALKGLKFSDI